MSGGVASRGTGVNDLFVGGGRIGFDVRFHFVKQRAVVVMDVRGEGGGSEFWHVAGDRPVLSQPLFDAAIEQSGLVAVSEIVESEPGARTVGEPVGGVA